MEFCIFHGNSFQNGFPEFAHILQVEFLTVDIAALVGNRQHPQSEPQISRVMHSRYHECTSAGLH